MTTSEIGRVTDPLTELSLLITSLREIEKKSDQPGYKVIGSLLDKTYREDGEFAAYSILYRRAENLKYIISTIPEKVMDANLKSDVLGSIQSVQSAFNADSFAAPWAHVRANFQERHLVAFKYAARDVRRYFPIREITPAEIKQADHLLGEALQELLNEKNLPRWMIDPLLVGVRDLLFAIESIGILGQDEVAQSYLLLHGRASGV